MPTRVETINRILDLLTKQFNGAKALIGFDFAIGYPLDEQGKPVMPLGRELCRLFDSNVSDDTNGNNNRFHVAGELNQRIMSQTGRNSGPFWGNGLPNEDIPYLPRKKPAGTGVLEHRRVERSFRSGTRGRSRPMSAWHLSGDGSVGGQSLTGLKYVHRLLIELGNRCHLWPFEIMPERTDAVTIAEIYPSMFPEKSPAYWFKDARQVIDTREALLELMNASDFLQTSTDVREGWILGVKP